MTVSIDLNPALLSQIESMAADLAAAAGRASAAEAMLRDFSVRQPVRWDTYSWRFDSNPTLTGFPGLEYDPATNGLSTFVENEVTCLRGTVVGSKVPVSGSYRRAEAKWTLPEAVVRTGRRSRIKFDVRLDVASGRWTVAEPDWSLLVQAHGFLPMGSPTVSVEAHGDEIRLRVMPDFHDQHKRFTGGVLWTGSITAMGSDWHTFEIAAQWGLDDNAAWVEMKFDGAQVVARTYTRNLLFDVQAMDTGAVATVDASHGYVGDASPGYWKLGPYQSPKFTGPRSVDYRHMELDVSSPVY